jgi:hypothetical protein
VWVSDTTTSCPPSNSASADRAIGSLSTVWKPSNAICRSFVSHTRMSEFEAIWKNAKRTPCSARKARVTMWQFSMSNTKMSPEKREHALVAEIADG